MMDEHQLEEYRSLENSLGVFLRYITRRTTRTKKGKQSNDLPTQFHFLHLERYRSDTA